LNLIVADRLLLEDEVGRRVPLPVPENPNIGRGASRTKIGLAGRGPVPAANTDRESL
jgi:hypothetical protein